MEPLTQRILDLTLTTVIKGVAITGLMAEVVIFYANRNKDRIVASMKKKIQSAKFIALNQLIKN